MYIFNISYERNMKFNCGMIKRKKKHKVWTDDGIDSEVENLKKYLG